jgi:3-phenylpropionate/trans-cinnamate dioxygenase ferredoxin reductase subunit
MEDRRFSVFYLRDDRLLAADTVNSPQDFAAARALIAQHAKVNASRLADRSIPLAASA